MPRFEPDSYDPNQQAADERLGRVAVLLAAAANHTGGFPATDEELEQLAAVVRDRIPEVALVVGYGAGSSLGPEVVRVAVADGVLDLSAPFSRSGSIFAALRADGRLVGGGVTVGMSFDDPEARVQLSEREQADMEEIFRRLRERGTFGENTPTFRCEQFITVVVPPLGQDGPVQIAAVELYADGLIVNYLLPEPADWDPIPDLQLYARAGVEPPTDDFIEKAQAEGGGNLRPGFRVEDDQGTRYLFAGRSGGGVDLERGSVIFTPGVPKGVRELRLSSYAGTVVVSLPNPQ